MDWRTSSGWFDRWNANGTLRKVVDRLAQSVILEGLVRMEWGFKQVSQIVAYERSVRTWGGRLCCALRFANCSRRKLPESERIIGF